MTRDGGLGPAQHTFGDVGTRLEELCLSCIRDGGVDRAGLAVMASDGTPETVYATNGLSARVEDRADGDGGQGATSTVDEVL
jgi:hypothetical protein